MSIDNKTLLILGLAAGGGFFLWQRSKKSGGHWSPGVTRPNATGAGSVVGDQSELPAVLTDSGGSVPASPETVVKLANLQASRSEGLSAKSKASRGIATAIATAGGRALQTGARSGYSVTAKQNQLVNAVAKSTPTKPAPKKKSTIVGKITSLGGAAAKTTIAVHKKAVTAQVKFAMKNPNLTAAAAGAVGGPGAAAATRAALILAKNRNAGGVLAAAKAYKQ